MANVISLDSSVLIDHFRLRNKGESFYMRLLKNHGIHCISSVAKYEVLAGVKDEHLEHWREEFEKMLFLPLTEPIVMEARDIAFQLRRDRKQLDSPDILIAATAMANGLPLATLNRTHFERIDGLKLVLPKYPTT